MKTIGPLNLVQTVVKTWYGWDDATSGQVHWRDQLPQPYCNKDPDYCCEVTIPADRAGSAEMRIEIRDALRNALQASGREA